MMTKLEQMCESKSSHYRSNLLELAARQALEALEESYENGFLTGIAGLKTIDTITALREALAEQAEQEPVAWAISHSLGLEFGSKYPMQETKEAAEQMARQHMGAVVVTPLYAAPVRTKDLTDDEVDYLIDEACQTQMPYDMFARAVIAADREKNK